MIVERKILYNQRHISAVYRLLPLVRGSCHLGNENAPLLHVDY